MGKFDYTIQILRDEIDSLKEFDERADLIPDIEAAIALLEAAGRVDKQEALHTIVDYSGGTWEKIRALLSALPDAEEKRVEDRKEPQ
jgi:hypothetical protein